MTHTTKHTPGPWVVVSTFNGTRFVETQEGHSVCVLADTNDAANAHLIAAAPAMYEALKGCLRVTKAWKSQAEMNGDTVETEAAVMEIRRIKAALTQAEGRQA